MNINEMIVGGIYSFTMRSAIIHGSRIAKAKLTGIVDINVASMIAPIKQQYAQIYPSLPSGTPYAPDTCKFFIFKQLNGETVAIADQWIVDGSVEESERIVYRVSIYDGELGDAAKIQAALTAIGKTEVKIETV